MKISERIQDMQILKLEYIMPLYAVLWGENWSFTYTS